jgi:hypothetical protein
MNVYFGKDKQNVTQAMTATHVIVRCLTKRVKGLGHRLFMYYFFSSPDIFDDLCTGGVNCCGTVRQNHKGIPQGLDRKTFVLG